MFLEGGGGVMQIVEQTLPDRNCPGKKFKRFFIHIDCYVHDPMIKYLFETVEKEGSAKVYYEKTKGVDRYWKVKIIENSK
jgi:hypothetical protein